MDEALEEHAETTDSTVKRVDIDSMLSALQSCTGTDFSTYENQHRAFMTTTMSSIQDSNFYGRLFDIHTELGQKFVVGDTIRGIEAWAGGETQLRVVAKSWPSTVDKLYRINIEQNDDYPNPPRVPTIADRLQSRPDASHSEWILPPTAHAVIDDLVRTKFVVPFADGVIDVSERIGKAASESGLQSFKRYHAKDSGYHARHHYVAMPVPDHGNTETVVALEIKVLTKMQDTLGELTHLLYELKRTGSMKAHKKRTLAWLFDTPDFTASYLGHAAHFIEATMVGLKRQLHENKDTNGQS